GEIFPVNPKHDQIDGKRCWPDVTSLPEAPDLAVICTPAGTIPGIVGALGARGNRAAIVISAGFGESHTGDGVGLQQSLLDAAKPYTLRILGPNCIGLQIPGIGLNASFAATAAMPGHLAFITQSGALLTAVLDWAQPRGIGFSHLISLGDMGDVDFGDLLDYLAGDGKTRAILAYMEGVTHTRKFMSAARAAARIKPVVVVKGGRHAEGARAAATHTGALAGSDAVYDAAFRRAGMLRVPSLGALFGAADILTLAKRPRGNRLAILTNGGGMGVLATDALMDGAGQLAQLTDETRTRLDAVLPTTWSRNNPVDIIGDADGKRYRAALDILCNDSGLDAILALYCPTGVSDPDDVASAVLAAVKTSPNIPIIASWVGGASVLGARKLLADARIPSYETPEDAVRAFMYLADYRRNQELLTQTPPSVPDEFTPDNTSARQIVRTALEQKREWLTEIESKNILAAYGIPTVPTRFATTPAEAATAAQEFNTPIALKIVSPQLTHKSDVGGVALGLSGPDAVKVAAEAMLEHLGKLRPDAALDGFSVQPMVQKKHAYELIAGIVTDAQFGPVILFGQGGTAVELISDKALGLPPLNMNLAHALISGTRIYRLLRGYRGEVAVDLDAIAVTLIKLAQMAAELPQIVELDINPLLADSVGVIALDARIKVRFVATGEESRLAIRPYPKHLDSCLTARDGRQFKLRPIVPEDEPALQHLFSVLTPEEIRMRFHVPMKAFPHTIAARFTQIDYDREMALVLTSQMDVMQAEIHGVVRMSADPDNENAEFALLVQKACANQHLGTQMLQSLVDYARQRGIGTLFGFVLSENQAMRVICRHLGFLEEPVVQDTTVVKVSLILRR
ncbi:MAG: GNAT family N-acetyltransferase, partial [Gammaproteobacteria bacterium]